MLYLPAALYEYSPWKATIWGSDVEYQFSPLTKAYKRVKGRATLLSPCNGAPFILSVVLPMGMYHDGIAFTKLRRR